MELIIFDLDGTLLDASSQVSRHTGDTLKQLRRLGIPYTVATGRTFHGARDLLQGHGFDLPHIYKNGVMVWSPDDEDYSSDNLLSNEEIRCVLEGMLGVGVTPFIFTLEPGNRHMVYHAPLQTDAERGLASLFGEERGMELLPVAQMPAIADISNISALGVPESIGKVVELVRGQEHLVAYAGTALEGGGLHWIDIHHSAASKGEAVAQLKRELGVSRVICFGDSDNDLSMFEVADESYAPANAKDEVRAAATAVIGHHDEDGISRFLRERYALQDDSAGD